MRHLATVRTIDSLSPIPGADLIEAATLDGWKVVVKRGEFKAGDKVVYLEIDSWVPHDLAPFLSKGQGPKDFRGVLGNRLRTVRLRGQVSQGLVLPLSCLATPAEVGADVTDVLGVLKWEAPVHPSLAGQVKGPFPGFAPKTDQERCQNILHEIFVDNKDTQYEVTLKLDGTSASYYYLNGELGACSRNLELKLNEENKDNTIVKLLTETGLGRALINLGKDIMLQGELMGPGIQGNREKLTHHTYFIFDIIDLKTREKLSPKERHETMIQLYEQGTTAAIRHVPVLARRVTLAERELENVEQLLAFADGPSINHDIREGLVFKSESSAFSFKAISNNFLLKE